MRFEVTAAFFIGVLLPVLETVRRGLGYWSVEFTTMFEDYVGGAMLLIAAWAAVRGLRWASPFLLVAWSAVTGMMTLSFVSQIEETVRGVDLEPNNGIVLCVKAMLFACCMYSLMLSFRRVT